MEDSSDKAPESSSSTKPRAIAGVPFCWQSKTVLKKIREAFDRTGEVGSTLLVYSALTEIASDKQSETFETTHSWIAGKCGVSPRTVQRRLNDLESVNLIEIVTPTLKAPCTYTLLAFGHDGVTIGHNGATFGQTPKNAGCPTLEESKKNLTKELFEEGAKPRPTSDSDSFLETLKANPAYQGINVDREYHKMAAWCAVNKKQPTQRRFTNWLNRCDKPMSAASSKPDHSKGF